MSGEGGSEVNDVGGDPEGELDEYREELEQKYIEPQEGGEGTEPSASTEPSEESDTTNGEQTASSSGDRREDELATAGVDDGVTARSYPGESVVAEQGEEENLDQPYPMSNESPENLREEGEERYHSVLEAEDAETQEERKENAAMGYESAGVPVNRHTSDDVKEEVEQKDEGGGTEVDAVETTTLAIREPNSLEDSDPKADQQAVLRMMG